MPDVNEIIISADEEKAIRDNAPDRLLPLNPTAQGYTGSQVRMALAKSIVGDDSLLQVLLEKLPMIKDILVNLQAQIDALFLVNQTGIVIFENDTEQNETLVPTGTIALTKQNGG